MAKKITKKTGSGSKAKAKQVEVKTHVIPVPVDEYRDALLKGVGMGGRARVSKNAPIQSNALNIEDDFYGLYGEGSLKNQYSDIVIIEPPFNPATLEKLSLHNNTLGACISTMETNIDGTGFEIINKKDPQNEKVDAVDPVVEQAQEFFKQPWIGESFTTIRKKLRVDLEKIGYGFLEVIRNPKGDVVFIRHIDAKTMRLIKLGEAVTVTKKINRGGREISASVSMRFRRFVQKIGTHKVFFKEFQADIDLDKVTGKWAEDGEKFPAANRATEVLYFTVNRDVNTPYGVPRWIDQMPSVLGSRRAEENNLEFFESGGVPPFMLFVQGGILATETRDAIENQLAQAGAGKQRGIVVEAFSSSGSLDDNNNVKVTVEKFGAGATGNKDSSFEKYDDKCAQRVRRSFRFSPIFLGDTDSYNFASAVASYMLGETQVFKPERDAFDEVVNLKLMPEILKDKAKDVTFRSIPVTVNDATQKLEALGLVADKQAITKGELVNKVNEVTGMGIRVAQGEENELPRLNQRGTSDNVKIEEGSSGAPEGGKDSDNVSEETDD